MVRSRQIIILTLVFTAFAALYTSLGSSLGSIRRTRIGLVIGSTRVNSNTPGIARHFTRVLSALPVDLDVVNLSTSTEFGHPLPFELEGIPLRDALASLPGARTVARKWSETVLNWDAMIILSPQYNLAMPAALKNALDHLYAEWAGLPVALISAGGRGGSALQDSARIVLDRAFKMDLVEKQVMISIPPEHIRGGVIVTGDEAWLEEYDEEVEEVVRELIDKAEKRKAGKLL